MAPVPTTMGDMLVPGTGGECIHSTFNPATGVQEVTSRHVTGVFVSANVDTTCFTLREVHCPDNENFEDDLIHFCDWPELRDTIDAFMAARAAEAVAAGEDPS